MMASSVIGAHFMTDGEGSATIVSTIRRNLSLYGFESEDLTAHMPTSHVFTRRSTVEKIVTLSSSVHEKTILEEVSVAASFLPMTVSLT